MPLFGDPLGEYDHVKAVPLEQAAKEYQIAEAKVAHGKTVVKVQAANLQQAQEVLSSYRRELEEKEYLVLLSASSIAV